MAVRTIEKYQYKEFSSSGVVPHFEISSIRLDTHCVANQNEICQYYKIYWIEDGSGEYQIDFKKMRIEQSGIFCLSPGQILMVENEKVRKGYQISFDKEFYCIEAHGKEIACNGLLFNNVHRATAIPLGAADIPIFKQLVDNLIDELRTPGAAHRSMVETYLRMFLIQALRKLDEQQPQLEKAEDEKHRLTNDFIALVDKHFRKIHSVKDYAEKLFISPKSLSKRLKEQGYKTPTEVIQDRILLQAKRDLRFSNKTIKEIAYDLGYDDPAYFSRLFAKKEGLSPLGYRKRS